MNLDALEAMLEKVDRMGMTEREAETLTDALPELIAAARRYQILRDDADAPVWVHTENEWGRPRPLIGKELDEVLDEHHAAAIAGKGGAA